MRCATSEQSKGTSRPLLLYSEGCVLAVHQAREMQSIPTVGKTCSWSRLNSEIKRSENACLSLNQQSIRMLVYGCIGGHIPRERYLHRAVLRYDDPAAKHSAPRLITLMILRRPGNIQRVVLPDIRII